MPFTVKDLLRIEVSPALGCTEPAAVALGAAAATSLLGGSAEIEMIEVWVDANVYKNGAAVSIPGGGELYGLPAASALGAIGGDATLGLQVLEPVTEDATSRASDLVNANRVKLNVLPDQKRLFIRTEVTASTGTACSVIEDAHDNIVHLSVNGEQLMAHPLLEAGQHGGNGRDLKELEAWLKGLSLEQLVRLVDDLDDEDIAFLEEGVQFNVRLAEYGLKQGSGLGVGKTLERLARQKLVARDMGLAAKIMTSAASDARMAGAKLPAMSSGGSGNHGLTAILPIWAVKDYLDCEPKTVLESIALSHIVTAYVKAHTGRLSALCGCSIAAGAGAAAGITHLMGGTVLDIANAIKNLSEDLAGVICDGAKAGCSLKLATAAACAVQAALFSLQGVRVHHRDGIIDASPEQTMKNIGTVSTQGMIEADRTILQIVMEKHFKMAQKQA
ncbi:MAG: serine dehydratase subunit alpha family protein [Acidobacteria bacterium]|nr:MAG: serine dehydratase subunit alpha family protein [Acidobacteriota bacterium]